MENKFNKFYRFLTLLTVLLFGIGQMWADATITLADVTPASNWYEVTGVGRVTNKKGNAFSDGDYNCTGTGYKTGSSYFTVQTYMAITGLQITATSTSNRTVNGIAIGDAGASSAPSSFPDGASATGSIKKETCDQVVTINFGTTVAANKYISIGLSGNSNIFSVTFIAATVTKHSVTYALNGGTGTTPTQADVAEGAKFTLHDGTTSITAPSGKEFAGWSDGTTTYLGGAEYTMGTSNVTLTAQWQDPAPKYTVTLMPAGGTCESYTGWTYDSGNNKYTKEVSSGAELALPTFTKTNRTFKTWRKAGPTDVTSPITVTADVTLTAVWNATVENVLYSWEGAEGGATETGGTATGSVDGLINVAKSGYYCLQINGNTSYDKYVQITLSGEEKVKTGDKIRYTGFYTNTGTKNAAVKMRASGGTAIFTGANLPRIEEASPRTDTYVVPEGINTASVQITRHQTQTSSFLTKLQIIREVLVEEANLRTVTFNYNDGGATANKVVEVASGSKVSAEAAPTRAHYRFHEWQLGGVAYDFATAVTADITLVADWTQLYTVTYAKGEESATGDAPTQDELAAGEKFEVAANTFTYAGHDFSTWNDGLNNFDPGMEYTMGSANVTLTAQWVTAATKYEITKGTHTNGNITIDLAEQSEGGTVTLTATPDEDYVFDAWDVYKTGESSTKVIVAGNNTFTMPAYAVTVDATFAADPRTKVLYVTSNTADATKANDKLYDALKDIYNVKIVGPTSDAVQSGYALVVLHESVGGGDYDKTAVAAAKAGDVPVLNTKSYFYNSGRFGWGTPNAGQSVKGATLNNAYCNIADHPLFSGVTVTDGFFEITDDAAAKCMQPVGSFTSGYEGYTLATTPNAESGNGCAIHEIPAGTAARGVSSGKYLMISVSNDKLNALNANGQKLFQNAAAYLIDGSASWTPIAVPTSATVTASPSAAYSKGDNISLTASATGVSATTTYTWYKGTTLEAAKEAGAIKAAATAAAGGNTYTKNDCVLGDAGIYWCVISNGTGCEASASVEITVVDASYTISFTSAHGTAPSATTGVSYTLPELTASGWEHQGWTASVNVFVDLEEVVAGTLIANGKMAVFGLDVTFTAVWAQVFVVTFNGNGHGTPIAPQDVVDGELATDPGDPSEIGWIFGGWFTDAECTEGNEWDFASDVVTEDTELFAKWTAFTGCTELWPATSGAALNVGDNVDMLSGSFGANIAVVGMKTAGSSIAYDPRGLLMGGGSADVISVTLNNDMAIDTKISVTLDAKAGDRARGLYLLNGTGGAVKGGTLLGWNTPGDAVAEGTIETFSYTVEDADGLAGTNVFRLKRQNSTYIKCIKVESCGDAIIYHNLTYAVDPAAKGTVTLGATSVRQGRTTTATYSEIASGYEFDEWQISGTGASITDASANPAVITMGTTDAVVTLKLKVETPSHTVTFNKMGKGDDIAPQNVKEGAKVTEPSVTEPEGWILEGWYKESTFDNKWNFASDVMSTSNIELFANWIADTSIKLVNKSTGAINTTNFTTGVTATEANSEKAAAWGGTQGAISGTNAMNKIVQYNATTDQTKIKISAYNTNNSGKEIYIHRILEGDDTEQTVETLAVASKTPVESEYYTFNNTKNRSFYLTTNSTDVKLLQVKVIDDGTAIKQAGQAGYSVNLNKGRVVAYSGTAINFEGLSLTTSSNYGVINSTELQTKSNVAFMVASPVTMSVTTSAAKYYVSQNADEDGTTATAVTTAGTESFDLTAGTWYIVPSTTSAVKLTNIAFVAPKCEQPTITPMSNSELCEGDAFAALNVTASVEDGGTLHYAWFKEAGATDEAVGTDAASYTPAADGEYYVIVTNCLADHSDNSATSNTITVTHFASAVITTAPLNQRGEVGDVVTLTVAATGKNVAYKWYTCDEDGSNEVALDPEETGTSINVTITADMEQWYKVKVTSDCGGVEAKAKVSEFVPTTPANVTTSILWNWDGAAWPASGEVQFTNKTTDGLDFSTDYELLADADAIVPNNDGFHSDMLYGKGQYVWRSGNKFFQGTAIKFNTTIAGKVRVYYRSTGNNKHVKVEIKNGANTTLAGTYDTGGFRWSEYVEVSAGEVEILCTATDSEKSMTRIQKIEFLALAHQRTTGYNVGDLGTVCLEDATFIEGANLYELSGLNEYGYLAFDQINSGELKAGKPYLFEVTNPSKISFYKPVGAAHSDSEIANNGMIGTFSGTTLYQNVAENYYYFSGRHIWKVNDFTVEIPIPAHRCYVDMDVLLASPAPVPLPGRMRMTLGINGKNTPTGVENVQGDKVQSTKVLIDGQLFILRGEKIFDATGRLVK